MNILCKSVYFLIFLFLTLGLSGKSAGQIETTQGINSSPIETDTVFIDDDFNSGTPGWGVYCFDTIQHGIDIVETNGVVYIYNGIYNEHLTIGKRIEILGENKDSTIVDGTNSGNVIYITTDSVTISDLMITNGGDYGIKSLYSCQKIIGNIFGYNYQRAIYIWQADSNVIKDNLLLDFSHGMYLSSSSYNLIENNTILHSGITTHGNYNDIIGNNLLKNADIGCDGWYNKIEGNKVSNSMGSALYMNYAEYCTISNNIFMNNGSGINLHACSNNTITENTICGNSGTGIILPVCMCGGCNDNDIYHNNWMNNTTHVSDQSTNNWDNGYPSGGNFWDDYSVEDNFSGPNQNIPGSDSIGDTPYYINSNGEDAYPLMIPYGMPPLADEIFVDDDFDETTPGWGYNHFDLVHKGVNYVDYGGTVKVSNGVYYETINVNKKLNIAGNDKDSVIIDGMGKSKIIYILADSVRMNGFTVRYGGQFGQAIRIEGSENCFLTNLGIIDCHGGIWCTDSDNSVILNNNITDCDGAGIAITGSENCQVKYNNSSYNRLGIGITESTNNMLVGNNFNGNASHGGIQLYLASNNSIIKNSFKENDGYGVNLMEDSDGNLFP